MKLKLASRCWTVRHRTLGGLGRTWNGNGLPTTDKILGAELRKRRIDFIRPFLEEGFVIDRDVRDQISGWLGLGMQHFDCTDAKCGTEQHREREFQLHLIFLLWM